MNSVNSSIDSSGYQNENFPKLHAVYWCTIHSSHHFDISPLSREIKMKVSLASRTSVNEPSNCKRGRVRTHYSTSEAAARRLGRIIQRIFLPNQEAALVEPFGNGLVRVGSQGLFSPDL